ncbi:MAG: type II secretion system protein, partial [bacterium]|nr:type II secretion system protein [bacterium]
MKITLQKFLKPQKTTPKLVCGFTLVEMIVAVGLFTVVMFIATGALLSVVSLNKKAQAQQSAISNLNYALENMARSIRTGTTYHCGNTGQIDLSQNCSGGDSFFAYESDSGDGAADAGNSNDQRVFRLANGVIQKSKDSGSTWMDITDPSIVIQNLTFTVTGTGSTGSGDFNQPQVRINIAGFAFVGD